eukprot:COSAG06_NODE_29034_length_563_cov_1.318966_1_plen_86_part_10
MLSTTKHVHAVIVALAIPLSVGIVLLGMNGDLAASGPPMSAFLLCVAVDAWADKTRPKHAPVYMTLFVLHVAFTALIEYMERQPPD